MTPLLEVCVEGIEGLLTAQRYGADRIELCSALSEDGLTPSAGTVTQALRLARIPLHVLVRPRAGDFVYTAAEQEVMLEDVRFLAATGVQGVVIGGLTPAGQPDLELVRRLKAAAGTLSVTFHRAFDQVTDPLGALDELAQLGVERVLTSGGQATGLAGREQLRRLLDHAGDRLTVLGCGGLRPDNVQAVLAAAPLKELHFAARQLGPNGSLRTDGALVETMRRTVQRDGEGVG